MGQDQQNHWLFVSSFEALASELSKGLGTCGPCSSILRVPVSHSRVLCVFATCKVAPCAGFEVMKI